jgi:hypothetical protein
MMYGDNGITVDLEEIKRVIAIAPIFALGFALFPERLLVDARSNEDETPMIQVVDPAGSARERVAWLSRRRPSLGPPQSLGFLSWPHSPGFLVESGVWERILVRVGADVEPEMRTHCDLALRQIQNLDLTASQALLRGDGCLSLWPRREVSEGRV